MRLPPLKALEAFEATARHRSVSEAAAELRVTSGAVSQQIRKLEAVLGVRLLERHGRGVDLTSWGHFYQSRIAGSFEALRQAHLDLARQRSGSGLVVSCLATVASRWLGPRLFDWQALHPSSKVRLVGAEAEPRLFADGVDFRISYGGKRSAFDHHCQLFTDWVVPACAPKLLAGRVVETPAAIFDFPLIGIEWEESHKSPPGWREWASGIGVDLVRSPELSFSLSSSALDAALNGRGFVLAQMAMIRDDLASGRLIVPFDRRMKLSESYFLAWDRSALDKPFGPAFRDWVVALSRMQQQLSEPVSNAAAAGL